MVRFLLLVLLILPSLSFGAETIYTWGYGDILAHILESVKILFQTNDFIGLFKIFLTAGILLVLLSYLGNRAQDPFSLIKFYLFTMLVWYLLLAPSAVKTTVYIDDKQNPNYSTTVTEVPYVIAKILSWFSSFEKVVADKMETVFSVPNDLKYSETGFLTAFGVMANANSHKIVDPYLYLSVNNYMEDCVFPDIVDGSKDVYTLSRSNDLWTDLGNTNPARTTKYYNSANPDGVIVNCDDAYSNITGDLNNYITSTGFKTLSNIIGGFSESKLNQILGTASNYYLNYSVTGQAYLQQAIAMNMFSEAFQNFAKVNGVSGTGLALGAAKAEETARNNMVLSGVLGAKYIPIIKGILTTLIVGLIPVLTLLLVTPMFKRVLFGFLMILGWLSLWHIGEVLINAIINVKASNYISSLANGNYNLLLKGAVDSSVLDYINTVSSFYWAIPTIAFLIASGFSVYAMNALSGQMAGKMQGATGGAAGEMATGSINTASSINTGRNWSFNSFAQMGNTGSYAMTWSDSFGVSSDAHMQNTGWIGNGNVGLNTGTLQKFSTEMQKLTGQAGPNLGDGRITGMIGRKDGNTYELQAGYMGDFAITKGTSFQVDKNGNITGTLHGYDRRTGREWTLQFAGGELVGATSTAGGEKVYYRHGKDGKDYATVETADQIKAAAVFDENGDTIANVSMPDKVNATDVLEKGLSEKTSDLSSLTDARRISDLAKEGNLNQKLSAMDYTFNLANNERWGTQESRRFIKDTAASALESTIANLSKGNDDIVSKAEKISKDRVLEYTAGGKGYIEVGSPGVLSKILGAKAGLRAEAGFQNAWISKDGLIVETKDGSYYKVDFTDSAKKEFTNRFMESLATDRTHSADYSEGRGVSVNNKDTSAQIRESVLQDIAEQAKQDMQTFERAKNLVAKEGININKDAMRHIVDAVHDITGKSYKDIMNEINNDPSKLDEYLKNDAILRDVSRRLYGDENKLGAITEAGKVRENENYLDISKRVNEAISNNDVNEIRKLQGEINDMYKKGEISEGDYNSLMKQLNTDYHSKPQDYAYHNYGEQNARITAQNKGVVQENSDKAFNHNTKSQVETSINSMSGVGLTNKIAEGHQRLVNKYGTDIKAGLDIEKTRLNNDIKKFNEKYGYKYSMEDIASGKALNEIIADSNAKLQKVERDISSIETLMSNKTVWNTLDDKTKENIQKQYNELKAQEQAITKQLADFSTLYARSKELDSDYRLYRDIQHYENAMPKVTYGEKPTDNGVFMANPDKKLDVPTLQYTQGPNYTFPNRAEIEDKLAKERESSDNQYDKFQKPPGR